MSDLAEPPPPPEEPKMEIHKPKPVHNWREFLKEYAIIVISVLTALGLEQMIETVHDRSRMSQARENIRTEIANDVGLMVTRDKINGCISHRLDEVDSLIGASAAGKLPAGPIWIGIPFIGAMANSKFSSATQSGAVSLMPSQEQAGYARIYAEFEQYYESELKEESPWAALRTLGNHPTNSPVLDWQLRSAVQEARTARFRMESAERSLRMDSSSLGTTANNIRTLRLQSVCIPLATPRADAGNRLVKGVAAGDRLDAP